MTAAVLSSPRLRARSSSADAVRVRTWATDGRMRVRADQLEIQANRAGQGISSCPAHTCNPPVTGHLPRGHDASRWEHVRGHVGRCCRLRHFGDVHIRSPTDFGDVQQICARKERGSSIESAPLYSPFMMRKNRATAARLLVMTSPCPNHGRLTRTDPYGRRQLPVLDCKMFLRKSSARRRPRPVRERLITLEVPKTVEAFARQSSSRAVRRWSALSAPEAASAKRAKGIARSLRFRGVCKACEPILCLRTGKRWRKKRLCASLSIVGLG
jgi:hypothetical protein